MRIFPKAKILSQDLPRRLYEGSPAFLCRTQLQGHPGWDPHSHGRFPYGTGASSMGSMGILGEWFTNHKYLWWWTNPNYRHINPISQRSTQLGNQSNSLTSIMNPSKPSYTSTYLVLWGGRYFTVSEQICGAHVFFFGQFFVGLANFIKVSSTIVLWSQFRCSMYRSKLQTRYTAGICILYCTHLKVDGSTQKAKYP